MPEPERRRAKVITVLNLKGGVGKTHTVWLLAAVCQERELRMLAFDTDTQANLTGSFLPEPDERPGVEALFNASIDQDVRDLIHTTTFTHIDIVPARPALVHCDVSDYRLWERSDLHLSLAEVVRQVRGEYDYVVFDCPPRLSLVSYAALCASDYVIIPFEAADWGAQGIAHVTDSIQHVHGRHNRRLKLLGYLVSRFKRARAYQQAYLASLRRHYGPLAFDTVIPDLAQFERSVIDRIPITLHSPSSEEAAIARRFFDEVEARSQEQPRGSDAGVGDDAHEEPQLAAE